MANSTKILFKRSSEDNMATSNNNKLLYGEPMLIDGTKDYLVLGPQPTNTDSGDTEIANSIFFRGMTKKQADNAVMYNDDSVITNLNGTVLKAGKAKSNKISDTGSLGKYYILCIDETYNDLYYFSYEDNGIYIDNRGVMHGAAWNDYAESRTFSDDVVINDLAGRVVCEVGDGTLKLSRERLQPCAYVISDTFGTTIGEGNINVAVAGKVLVYTDSQVELGDCVAAGFDGKAVKMTRQEIIDYPDRILGTVIEVPEEKEFNGKNIEGRVWIRVR